jgi:hypothetical protein
MIFVLWHSTQMTYPAAAQDSDKLMVIDSGPDMELGTTLMVYPNCKFG